MICGSGGGTVVCSVPFRDFQCLAHHRIRLQDLAVHKIIGSLNNLENVEVCARSAYSLFLNPRFRELARTLFADHPDSLDAASSAYFIETDQLVYMGESDVPLHLLYSRTQCSLRADLIHIRRKDRRIDALLLMGGFSEGEYLFKCVDSDALRRARAADHIS
ncbi:hypothetical protein BS47DRAFT_1397623 [Hydnum rufescens UP504]|uniref:Uncharacterized protein n=1 Tax=Hydnum rufescens UP504 TaxID=1448309 RepID=A0A9P6DN53_9AGAM|nr:hypothetical protein BS47DRAFT_1397623 [Hydnum rufescens UP504]